MIYKKNIAILLLSISFVKVSISQTQYNSVEYHQFNSTNNGYMKFGANLSSYFYFSTSKNYFYFDKPVYSNGFISKDNILNLEASQNFHVQIQPRSPLFGLVLKKNNSSDFANIKVTNAGVGIGYNTSSYHLLIDTEGNVNFKNHVEINLNKWFGFGNRAEGFSRLLFHHTGTHGYIDYKDNLHFRADLNWVSALSLYGDGTVGIGFGTTYLAGQYLTQGYKLAVKGEVLCEGIKCVVNVPRSDFVFESDYILMDIIELERFIRKNKHLPEVPS